MFPSGRGVSTILAIALIALPSRASVSASASATAPATRPPDKSPVFDIAGSVRLLEKGKPSTDRTLLPRNTVVYFQPAKKGPAPKPLKAEMSTFKKEFKPRLVVVPVGSTVNFPNLDPILHNAFSISGGNSFDLGLAGKGPGKVVTFKEPGIVRVFCNVHHGMFAYVVVVDTPYWAQVGDDGSFRIPGAPAGPGKLTVWNERSAPSTRDLTLPSAAPLDLGVEITMPRIPPHKNKLGKPYGGTNYG
jgi:plastocyanin